FFLTTSCRVPRAQEENRECAYGVKHEWEAILPAHPRYCHYAAGPHVIVLLSYANPGADFSASLVVSRVRYDFPSFIFCVTDENGTATSFSPMPRKPPTLTMSACTFPSWDRRTSFTS